MRFFSIFFRFRFPFIIGFNNNDNSSSCIVWFFPFFFYSIFSHFRVSSPPFSRFRHWLCMFGTECILFGNVIFDFIMKRTINESNWLTTKIGIVFFFFGEFRFIITLSVETTLIVNETNFQHSKHCYQHWIFDHFKLRKRKNFTQTKMNEYKIQNISVFSQIHCPIMPLAEQWKCISYRSHFGGPPFFLYTSLVCIGHSLKCTFHKMCLKLWIGQFNIELFSMLFIDLIVDQFVWNPYNMHTLHSALQTAYRLKWFSECNTKYLSLTAS